MTDVLVAVCGVVAGYVLAHVVAIVRMNLQARVTQRRCECGHVRGFHVDMAGRCMSAALTADDACACRRFVASGRKP